MVSMRLAVQISRDFTSTGCDYGEARAEMERSAKQNDTAQGVKCNNCRIKKSLRLLTVVTNVTHECLLYRRAALRIVLPVLLCPSPAFREFEIHGLGNCNLNFLLA